MKHVALRGIGIATGVRRCAVVVDVIILDCHILVGA